jgi:hypothetical protein
LPSFEDASPLPSGVLDLAVIVAAMVGAAFSRATPRYPRPPSLGIWNGSAAARSQG